MRATVEWILLPAAGPQEPGPLRFVAFAAPHLEVEDGEAMDQPLSAFPRIVDWPAEVAALTLGVSFDDAEPVSARIVSEPDSALWRSMFPPTTRVEGFVREHPDARDIATFDAITIADTILDGYTELAAEEPVLETPWDEEFWTSESWGIPEPEQPPEVKWSITEIVLPQEVGVEGLGGETGEEAPTVGEATGRGARVVNRGPSIRDRFTVIPKTPWVLSEEDLYGTGGEGGFVTANRSLFRHPEEFVAQSFTVASDRSTGLVAFADQLDATTEWSRFAAFNRLASIWSEDAARVIVDDTGLAAPISAEPPEVLAERQFDFHRMMAALGAHPAVLRSLGLIVDLVCDAPLPDAVARIRLSISTAGESVHATHATRVSRTADGIVVTRADGTTDELLGMERCRVEQFDFEGAGRMLFELVAAEEATGRGEGDKPPTLRSTGLRLLQRGTASELALLADTNGRFSDAGTADAMTADDVHRGGRIDVFDEATGRWASLHARRTTYVVHDEVALTAEDEGHMHITMTSRSVPAGAELPADGPVGISDAIASWDGWSLAAPRPGKVVTTDTAAFDPDRRAESGASVAVEIENTPFTSCGLSIRSVVVPGSLPRLRFGRSYRMRVRTVDLAGQSIDLATADELCAQDPGTMTEPVMFRRFDPVPPPEITWTGPVLPAEQPPGETERRIVVRSGLDPEEEVFGEHAHISERMLFPPAASVSIAEWHGVFDDAVGKDAATSARKKAYELAATEAGAVEAGATETRYLPDPASSGVSLWNVPGLPAEETFTVPWPVDEGGLAQPVRLRVCGIGPGEEREPDLDEDSVLYVYLPAGSRTAMKAASIVAQPEIMALPHVWESRRGREGMAFDLIASGRHPHVTPAVTIELVHAVPRPLAPPVATAGDAIEPRSHGETFVCITRSWAVDRPSTASLVLRAAWSRPRDDLGAPVRAGASEDGPDFLPFTQPLSAVVGGTTPVRLASDADAGIVVGSVQDADAPATVDLGFTGHVMMRIRAEATSRFVDFFPPEFREPYGQLPDHFTVAGEWETVNVRSTERAPAPVVSAVLPLLVHRRDGSTWIREGGWLRVWFRRPWFLTGENEWPAIVAVGDGQPRYLGDPRYPYASLVGADPGRAERYDGSTQAEIYGAWPAAWAQFNSVNLTGVSVADEGDLSALYLSDRGIDYDPARDEWFMDVRIQTPGLAGPFVRLAVARDQPESLPDGDGLFGVRVSEVVLCEPITVLPDRTVTCTETAAGAVVAVTGPVARFYADVDGNLTAGSSVEVELQRRVESADPLLAWEAVWSAPLPYASARAFPAAPEPGDTLDTGQTFAWDPTSPEGEYRLLIVERDRSASVAGDIAGGRPQDRIVFAEIVPVSRALTPYAV